MTQIDQESPWEKPGSIFNGKYKIVRRLGTGAFGGVFLAEHILMHKQFAIKMLHDAHSGNDEAVQRFQREAQAAANIDHPNICAATDYGYFKGCYYIVMEYLDGKSLYEIENEIGRFDILRALHIVIQVCSALERAHEIGIVHRDLKPENIVLVEHEGDKDFVKITDFGIAQIDTKTEDVRLTQAGMVYGSPLYLSPEQARADVIDHRSDLYSVGVILYELLSAQLPFMGETAATVLAKHVTDPPPTFAIIAPDLETDSGVEKIIQKLLSKHPSDRYQSATELKAALEAAKERIERKGIQQRFPLSQKLAGSYARLPKTDRTKLFLFGSLFALFIAIVITIVVVHFARQNSAEGATEATRTLTEAEKGDLDNDLAEEEDTSPRVDADPLIKSRKEFLQSQPVSEALALASENKDEGILALQALLGISPPEEEVVSADPKLKGVKKKGKRAKKQKYKFEPLPDLTPVKKAHLHFLIAQQLLDQNKLDDAFRELQEVAYLAPNYTYDPDFNNVVFSALQGGSAKGVQLATSFIKNHINRPMGRRLAELAEHDKVRNTRKQSLAILEETGYFKKLPKWNRLTIRLRHAIGCEENRKYVIRIGELRDARALGALRRFTAHPMTGCGPDKQEDCWGCLRPDLRKAVDRLEGRE